MKRLLVLLVAILLSIPLALGGIAGAAYYATSEDAVPRPSISVMDVAVKPGGYTWRAPVFGGLIYRDFSLDVPPPSSSIGQLTQAILPLTPPPGYKSRATVYRANEALWSGNASELAGYRFLDNGRYSVLVECERAAAGGGGGVIRYHVAFTVRVQPRHETGGDRVAQGDMVAIRVFNLSGDQVPVAETDLGKVVFTPSAPGTMTGFVPVGHDCPSGSYTVTLSVGVLSWDIAVRVAESRFGPESIETAAPVPGPKAPAPDINPALTRDYYNTIAPLLEESAALQYWDGLFQQPVAGAVIADYGTLHQTNQDSETTRWAGIDIEAPEGSPVAAPNAGVVVFADELDATGNTVVIDHGGGLMSLLYYMDELAVEAGDMVKTGQKIGAVGQTGRVNSPRLHYEVRLGQATVNPHLLFSGTSQLYHFAER